MVREGLRRFEGVEPFGNSVQVPYTPCSHCEDEVREGSVQSNNSELTSKTSTHLAFSALKWFENVRVKMRFEKVRYSRTTPNSRYTPFFLCTEVVQEGSRRFEGHSEIVYRYHTHTLLPL